jgi:hypothetical protein
MKTARSEGRAVREGERRGAANGSRLKSYCVRCAVCVTASNRLLSAAPRSSPIAA